MKKLAIIICLLAGASLYSQKSLSIIDYNIDDFPVVSARFFAYGNDNKPVLNYTRQQFEISDNGSPMQVNNVSCENQAVVENKSIVLAIDLGMSHVFLDSSHFNFGISVAQEIVKLINLGESECAITSFDFVSYLQQDFTTNQNLLLTSFTGLEYKNSSFFDAGFLYELTGALDIAARGVNNRSIILITDGNGSLDEKATIDFAKKNGISIFVLTLYRTANDRLRNVCSSTGGNWLDSVNIKRDPVDVAKDILSLTYGYTPCTVQWQGELNCDEVHDILVSIPSESINDNISYVLPDSLKPRILSDPPYLGFSSVVPDGSYKDLQVELTAKNGNIQITQTSIPHPDFTILNEINPSQPYLLEKNKSHSLDIRYTPTDSAIVFTKLVIESNACFGYEILITAGFPNTPPKTRTITLVTPDCGDILLIGDETTVEWTGLLPRDVIQLEYSTDNGQRWDTLAKNVTDLEYDWIVPDKPTEECLIRAIQMWPNNVGRTLDLRHGASVNSAFFNSDGTLVVTSSNDTTAVIWNSNTGEKMHTLAGHSKPVTFAHFSPNNDYVVTASGDSTAIVWDIETGEQVRVFREHKGLVRSAKFSPNGVYVVSASYDNTVKVWEAISGSVRRNIIPPTNRVWHATFDPTGSYVLVGDNTGIAKMYDLNDGSVYRQFDVRFGGAPFGSAIHTTFSPDGSLVSIVNQIDKKASIWNVATADTVYTVSHLNDTTSNPAINSTSFFYHPIKGNRLFTAGVDNARLWIAETGSPILPTLNDHTNSVQTAVFNFDGSRILTASWDSTSKIWNVDDEGRALQIDTTDCMLTIARAEASADIVDFKEVPVFEARDTSVSAFIKNLSPFPYTIKSVNITEGDMDEFRFIDNYFPAVLDSLDSLEVQLSFTPKQIGERLAYATIEIPGGSFKIMLTGYGIKPEIQINQALIDFGDVEIGDYREISISKVVENSSLNSIKVDSVLLGGPDSDMFIMLEGDGEHVLNPGSGIDIRIRYTPENIGRNNAIISYYNNGLKSPVNILLYGEGTNPVRDTVELRVGDAEGLPGDIVEIPIYISSTDGDLNPNISGFNYDMRFNSTLLQPLDHVNSSVINGSQRTINISSGLEESTIIQSPVGDGVLAKLRFRVGLGNDTHTNISIENAAPIGIGKIIINEVDGAFSLNGVCEEGGVRLFDSEGIFLLEQNTPNPFSGFTNIEFEIIEKGRTRLYVLNFVGEKVAELLNNDLEPGRYTFRFDADGLASGSYFYILETPVRTYARTLNIRK